MFIDWYERFRLPPIRCVIELAGKNKIYLRKHNLRRGHEFPLIFTIIQLLYNIFHLYNKGIGNLFSEIPGKQQCGEECSYIRFASVVTFGCLLLDKDTATIAGH